MDDTKKLHLASPLLTVWYHKNRRQMPWRENPSPYRIWVSEIMLQQTRVSAVIPYFDRFVKALPTILDLAAADEQLLLKLWEGLGYYSRVRNMQKAAKEIEKDFGGELPHTKEELLSLTGIGPYTAGAIASIAFGQPVSAVDGNVLRVISRLLGSKRDISLESTKRWASDLIESVLPDSDPSIFNQALMELGALTCIPNGQPLCFDCPWKSLCEAFAKDLTDIIPTKAPKKKRRIEEYTVLQILTEDRVATVKRPDTGLLAGLWTFPMLSGKLDIHAVTELFDKDSCSLLAIEKLKSAKHIFTHIEWHMQVYRVKLDRAVDFPDAAWVTKEEFESLPFPSAMDMIKRQMEE